MKDASARSPCPSWLEDRDRLTALAHEIEPSVRLLTKDALFWRVLGGLAAVCTAGGIKQREFCQGYATTLGPLQAYPREWSSERVEAILVHEARHTWQARMCGLGIHPWLGLPVFAALYLIVLLPLGLAIMRLLFELDAERVAWRHALARGAAPERILARARQFGATVCSATYGWALPRRLGVPLFELAAHRVVTAHLGRTGSSS